MKIIEVVVALIINAQQEILIARRQAHQHQGGLWEFPGGKREANEERLSALQREIDEEIGLHIHAAEPFMQLSHDYGDKKVLLDVWCVHEFSGKASGREGQEINWIASQQLDPAVFPAANVKIIKALQAKLV